MPTSDDAFRPQPPIPVEAIQTRPGLSLSPHGATPTEPSPPFEHATPFEQSPLVDCDIYERPRFPIFPVLSLLLAAGAVGFAFADAWSATAILSAIGVSFGVVFSYDWFRPRHFRVTAEGISISRPRLFVPFGDIRELAMSAGERFPVHVVFGRGSFDLPSRLTCDPNELLRLVRSRVSKPRDMPETPPMFDAFLRQQTLLYPPDQIHVFRGAARPVRPTSARPLFQIGIACLLPLPPWIVLANWFPRREEFVITAVVGGMIGFIFLICALAARFSRGTRIKNAEDAVLIVTPAGLAMSQADLRGELRWTEVQKLVNRSGSFQWSSQSPAGLTLRVKGADIVIADIYDWPLDAILTVMRRYTTA